jgi:hypothetical protein
MILPSCEGNRYTNCGIAVLEALTKDQLKNGTIYDIIDKANTPEDHYAHTFFALASLLSCRYQSNCSGNAKKALEYFINIPAKKKGHHEFNILACLLIMKILKQESDEENSKLSFSSFLWGLLNNYAKQNPFEAKDNTPHGNNWIAIQALSLLLRYQQFNEADDLNRSNLLLDNFLLKLQLQDGIFYDAPRSVNSEHIETPLTYHAKFCMILSLYAQISNRSDIYQAVINGLDAYSKVISPNGEGFYFGRTNNAIFGYASALYAYETMMSHLLQSKTGENITRRLQIYQQAADSLFAYLMAMQEQDGYLRLTPGASSLHKAGWDSYMHHTVYNAYASALLLMTPHAKVPRKNSPANEKFSIELLEDSGFLALKYKRSFLALNVKGQKLDYRYAGMVPLTWQVEGTDLLSSPPYGENLKLGFIPALVFEDTPYVPVKWRNTHIVNNKYGVTLFAEGMLNELSNFRLKHRGTSKPYAFALNLLRKTGLTSPVKSAITPRKSSFSGRLPFALYRGITISKKLDKLFVIDTVKKSKELPNLQVFSSSILLSSTNIRSFNFQNGGLIIHLRNGDMAVKFKSLSPLISRFYRTSPLDTSKGPATLVTPQTVLLQDSEETFHSVALLQVAKKGQDTNYKTVSENDTITIFENSTELLSLNNVKQTINMEE